MGSVDSRRRVIVVGAGVSGLSAAFRLKQEGFEVTVLEAEDRVGGKTMTNRRDGFILNRGATVLSGSYAAMRAIARDAGIEDQIVKVPATIGVVAGGEVHWLRGAGVGAVTDFARTRLLSARSKLLLARGALDAFRARKQASYVDHQSRAGLDTESVADYADRRLNAEIRDRLLDPVLGSLFIVDGLRISVADFHFTLSKMLGGGILGYRGGMDFFARALADRLDVRTSAPVSLIERTDDGARVTWSTDGEVHTEDVDGVVLSVAAPLAPVLYPGLDPAIQGILLEGLGQVDIIGLRFALSERPEREAVLVAVPSGELDGIATVMFEHHISPGCAPAGKGLIGALMYHEWSAPRLDRSDEELIEEALPTLEHVVPGITDLVEFAEVTRWSPAALHTRPGTHKLIAELHDRIDPGERVQLAGDFLSVPSINGSIVSGEQAARRLRGALAS